MRVSTKTTIEVSGRQRTKQYIETCEICRKKYVATRKGSKVCGSICRAQKARNKHMNTFNTQKEIIESQANVIDKVLPRVTGIDRLPNIGKSPLLKPINIEPITKELSKVTGKNLTECKRPDGEHLYTDQDIKILLGRIIIDTYQPRSEVALFNKFNIMDLIEDFEHRFKCKFDDVKRSNSHIQTGTTAKEHYAFAQKYAHLHYSRDIEQPPFKVVEGRDSLGRYQCKNCGGWFGLNGAPPESCLRGKKHEFK
jgi:hypothetical protein